MAFRRPTLPQLVDRAAADIASRLPGADASLRRSAVEVFARVLAAGQSGLYGYLDFLAKNLLPDTSIDEFLLRQASIWGIAQKAAAAATGNVVATGTNGTAIPLGSILQRSDGAQFSTNAAAVIAAGTATIAVTAVVAGASGNTVAATQLTFAAPIAGMNNLATVDNAGLGSGADIETIDSLRQRLLRRIQQPPQGGAGTDYVAWSLMQPGVTRAWLFPWAQGLGTVTLIFVMDGRANIIPLPADVTAVQAALNLLRPVTAGVIVAAPIPVACDFNIHLNPSTAAIRSAVTAAITDLIAREAIPGGTIYKSHIDQAIANAVGEVDHLLVAPAADVVMAAGSISTPGAFTWS